MDNSTPVFWIWIVAVVLFAAAVTVAYHFARKVCRRPSSRLATGCAATEMRTAIGFIAVLAGAIAMIPVLVEPTPLAALIASL